MLEDKAECLQEEQKTSAGDILKTVQDDCISKDGATSRLER
jgi:hypothetical protein